MGQQRNIYQQTYNQNFVHFSIVSQSCHNLKTKTKWPNKEDLT